MVLYSNEGSVSCSIKQRGHYKVLKRTLHMLPSITNCSADVLSLHSGILLVMGAIRRFIVSSDMCICTLCHKLITLHILANQTANTWCTIALKSSLKWYADLFAITRDDICYRHPRKIQLAINGTLTT